MRTSLSGAFTLAALAAAVVVASTIPATSQVARPLSALAGGDKDDGLVIQVRRGLGGVGFRGGGGGGMRFAHGGFRGGMHHVNRHGHRHHGHHHGGNHWNGWGWGAAGLALGYGLGYGYGAYGYPYGYDYDYGYGYPAYASATCVRHVRVYDRSRGTHVTVRRQVVC